MSTEVLFGYIQGQAKRRATGCVNFGATVAYCLALPAAVTQPGDHLLAEPCTSSPIAADKNTDASSFRPMPSRRWNAPFLSCRFVRIRSAICFFAFLFSSCLCVCVCVCAYPLHPLHKACISLHRGCYVAFTLMCGVQISGY